MPRPRAYVISFSVKTPVKISGFFTSACLKATGPFTFTPLNKVPEGSIFTPSSSVLHCPTASKFSREKPIGSMALWQPAQVGLLRCCSMRTRKVVGLPLSDFSLRAGIFGGGGFGGNPTIFVKIHFPRLTGEVRVVLEVNVRILACPSNPRRF